MLFNKKPIYPIQSSTYCQISCVYSVRNMGSDIKNSILALSFTLTKHVPIDTMTKIV